jgi:hypothetical protein
MISVVYSIVLKSSKIRVYLKIAAHHGSKMKHYQKIVKMAIGHVQKFLKFDVQEPKIYLKKYSKHRALHLVILEKPDKSCVLEIRLNSRSRFVLRWNFWTKFACPRKISRRFVLVTNYKIKVLFDIECVSCLKFLNNFAFQKSCSPELFSSSPGAKICSRFFVATRRHAENSKNFRHKNFSLTPFFWSNSPYG